MSISAVKNINIVANSKSNASFTSKPEVQSENNCNTGKLLLLTGLTALGAVGIYLATRGKKGAATITDSTQKQ